MSKFSADNPFASAGVDTAEPAPAPVEQTDVSGLLELTAEGVGEVVTALFEFDATEATLDAIVDVVAAELSRRANAVGTLDDLLTATVQARRAKEAFDAAYGDGRKRLWSTTGPGDHATESGRTFKFTAPSTSRRTDTKKLQDEYPDVYAAVVKTVEPKADAVGTLRLTAPKKGAK